MPDPASPAAGFRLPGSIRAVIDVPGGGRILTAGFPGLVQAGDDPARFDHGACRATLDGLRACGADRLVVLAQTSDVGDAAFAALQDHADAQGIRLIHRPVPDYSVPDAAFMDWWQATASDRAAIWSRGEALAFCCRFGAGRSGTMASLCLIETGLEADTAIAGVRRGFPPSVETRGQEDWLRQQAQERRG